MEGGLRTVVFEERHDADLKLKFWREPMLELMEGLQEKISCQHARRHMMKRKISAAWRSSSDTTRKRQRWQTDCSENYISYRVPSSYQGRGLEARMLWWRFKTVSQMEHRQFPVFNIGRAKSLPEEWL